MVTRLTMNDKVQAHFILLHIINRQMMIITAGDCRGQESTDIVTSSTNG